MTVISVVKDKLHLDANDFVSQHQNGLTLTYDHPMPDQQFLLVWLNTNDGRPAGHKKLLEYSRRKLDDARIAVLDAFVHLSVSHDCRREISNMDCWQQQRYDECVHHTPR